MTPWNWVQRWPAYRQATGKDRLGLGAAAKSAKTQRITPRTKTADTIVKSVCPYCAVGCGQNVYVSKEQGGSGGTHPPRRKVVQIEGDPDSPVSRGRLCPKGSATLPGLGTSFGRGGATTFQQDLQNSDCIVIEGSNMAEAHPVGFQWVMEAKARGAKVIHIDPRFSRTSAMADLFVPVRAGADI